MTSHTVAGTMIRGVDKRVLLCKDDVIVMTQKARDFLGGSIISITMHRITICIVDV